jgi:hypothetical protein
MEKSAKRGKIMVCGCVHTKICVVRGAKLVMHGKIMCVGVCTKIWCCVVQSW